MPDEFWKTVEKGVPRPSVRPIISSFKAGEL